MLLLRVFHFKLSKLFTLKGNENQKQCSLQTKWSPPMLSYKFCVEFASPDPTVTTDSFISQDLNEIITK